MTSGDRFQLEKALSENLLLCHYVPSISSSKEYIVGYDMQMGYQMPGQDWQHVHPGVLCSGASADCARLWQWQLSRLESCIAEYEAHQARLILSELGIALSLQLFSLQLETDAWALSLLQVMERRRKPGIAVEVSLVECGNVQDEAVAEWSFEAVRRQGVRLTLSHFPNNTQSFALLGRHKFDKVKLSRELMPSMEDSVAVWSKKREVLRGLINTVKMIDAEIVLDGIDRESQLNFFRPLAVTHWQGDLWEGSSDFKKALDMAVRPVQKDDRGGPV